MVRDGVVEVAGQPLPFEQRDPVELPRPRARPEPQRNRENGSGNRYTSVFSSGSAPVSTGTTAQAPKAIPTTSSGRVRRHRSVGSSPAVTTTETTGDRGSRRSNPSSTAATASTPTRAQSHRAREGG
ncbi:hypothetical protein [Saccharothrix lopnurensis]|uniref:Uncharacterized protein n=1 Tax=Saccharothrix lopnurensis TaxID=1670621 RepID=A0ABW1NZ42_9PSEU